MKTKFNIFLLLMTFPMLCLSQQVTRTRQEVLASMEEYRTYHYNDFDYNHTNKWQNNYYDADGEHNHSTFLGYEGFQSGAPYGYGIKDDLTTLENKIYGDGNIYDLSATEEQYITLYPTSFLADSADQIVITSTRYLENDWLTMAVDVDDENTYWQLKLYQKGFGYDSDQATVYEVRNEIWHSDWLTGDQTLNTSPIEYTGKYCLTMETWGFFLTAHITLTKPQTVPDENNYACGSHSNHYYVCSKQGFPLPSQWAFGIDCSGFVSWGYGLPIASYGTNWYAQNFYPVDYAEAEMADYLVKPGDHIVMIENKFGDNINIYHSAGRLLNNPNKPDGTDLESNKDIFFDYIMLGYDSRTPWYPVGIEDYIAITSGPTLLNQQQTEMYEARFVDEPPYGDKITGYWHWKLVACHSGGEVIIDSRNTSGEYSTTAILHVPDLDAMIYSWIRNEYNSIVGKIRLSATDNSGTPHGTTRDIAIIEDIETPTITECYGHNESVTLSFTAYGATLCEIFYDIDSGSPYTGNDADQGPSPIVFQGDSGQVTLTGLTNGTTYYFAIKAHNYYESTNFSNEECATPITTSGTLSQNETWPGLGNPSIVNITGDVTVPANLTLTIEPGTTLQFDPSVSLNIYGCLDAIGTWDDRITFECSNPSSYWGGIIFQPDCDENSTLTRCDISRATYGVLLDHVAPAIRYYNSFTNCGYGIYGRYCAPDGFERCDFDFNLYAGIYLENGNAVGNWHIPILHNNFGSNSTGLFIYDTDVKVWNQNYFFDNQQYGIYATSESDIEMIDYDDGINTMEESDEGELYFRYYSSGWLGDLGLYDLYGATNRILGPQCRVTAYDNSLVEAWEVWWGVYWREFEQPPSGTFIRDRSSLIRYYFPLEFDPEPSLLANSSTTRLPVEEKSSLSAEAMADTSALTPLERAINFIHQKKYAEATAICDSIILQSPHTKEAIHAQSLLWRISRRTQQSDFSSYLSRNMQQYATLEISAAAQRTHAIVQAGKKDYQLAVSLLAAIESSAKFKGSATQKHALFDLIDIYHFDLKQDDRAKKYFEALATLFPNDDLTALAARKLNPSPTVTLNPQFQIAKSNQAKIILDKFILEPNHPNPFNPETQIKFALPELAHVSLIIYNIAGQRIKTLVDKELSAGYCTFYWDGTDESGMNATSGTYFYQLKTKRFQATRKMVLLR